jgi:hypothetical protein
MLFNTSKVYKIQQTDQVLSIYIKSHGSFFALTSLPGVNYTLYVYSYVYVIGSNGDIVGKASLSSHKESRSSVPAEHTRSRHHTKTSKKKCLCNTSKTRCIKKMWLASLLIINYVRFFPFPIIATTLCPLPFDVYLPYFYTSSDVPNIPSNYIAQAKLYSSFLNY